MTAWRMSSSLIPCLRADSYISTAAHAQYRIAKPWARCRPTDLPHSVLGDPDIFFWSGFGDTLDQLIAQNIKGISILVERLYAG